MIDLNGTAAARRAGYAEPCSTQAWHLLQVRDIRDEIDRRISERRALSKITHEHIANMLYDLASVEPLDIWTEKGELRPLQEMPPHARKAIKSIKRVEKEHAITGQLEVKLEVELWDKKGAIELLGKYKKMFSDKLEIGLPEGTKVSFSINGVIK
jgi:phage terminase small subunit